MLGYVTIGCNDMAAMGKFYDLIAGELGGARTMEYERFIAWGGAGGTPGFGVIKPANGEPATVGNGMMVALAAKSQAQVDALYELALANGGTCEGPPGARSPGFYAAYFRDIEGNKLNAFYMGDG
jgi:catechol 2,3-dioxygenase-like lactoylglutathione lyase family enzyme